LLNGFFNQQIHGFVDTSGAVWKPQTVDNIAPPLGPADAAQFQRAAKIRDIWFGGGSTLAVKFDIKPLMLDAGAKAATLDFGGSKVAAAAGSQAAAAAVSVTWPGSPAMGSVSLTFDPPATGAPVQESGPWGLFRLFARGLKRDPAVAGRYVLSLKEGDRSVDYEVKVNGAGGQNPFDLGPLQDFRCPVVQ
jgi:type VI secretion system protein ImpL